MEAHNNYSFQDWIDGKPEPDLKYPFSKDRYSINYAKKQVFDWALVIDLRQKVMTYPEWFLDTLEYLDRIEFLQLEIQKTEKFFDSLQIDRQNIILKDFSLEGITAKNHQFVELGLKNELGCDLTFLKNNSLFQGRSSDQYLKHLRSLLTKYIEKIEVKSKSKTTPTKDLTLKELFKEKFGNDEEYQSLKKKLLSKELLSDDLSTWIGTKENGKTQLASVIKYAGQNNLGRKLTNKEVVFISEIDFKNRVDIQTAKNGKYELAEYYFI
jgi:hypothetical protein